MQPKYRGERNYIVYIREESITTKNNETINIVERLKTEYSKGFGKLAKLSEDVNMRRGLGPKSAFEKKIGTDFHKLYKTNMKDPKKLSNITNITRKQEKGEIFSETLTLQLKDEIFSEILILCINDEKDKKDKEIDNLIEFLKKEIEEFNKRTRLPNNNPIDNIFEMKPIYSKDPVTLKNPREQSYDDSIDIVQSFEMGSIYKNNPANLNNPREQVYVSQTLEEDLEPRNNIKNPRKKLKTQLDAVSTKYQGKKDLKEQKIFEPGFVQQNQWLHDKDEAEIDKYSSIQQIPYTKDEKVFHKNSMMQECQKCISMTPVVIEEIGLLYKIAELQLGINDNLKQNSDNPIENAVSSVKNCNLTYVRISDGNQLLNNILHDNIPEASKYYNTVFTTVKQPCAVELRIMPFYVMQSFVWTLSFIDYETKTTYFFMIDFFVNLADRSNGIMKAMTMLTTDLASMIQLDHCELKAWIFSKQKPTDFKSSQEELHRFIDDFLKVLSQKDYILLTPLEKVEFILKSTNNYGLSLNMNAEFPRQTQPRMNDFNEEESSSLDPEDNVSSGVQLQEEDHEYNFGQFSPQNKEKASERFTDYYFQTDPENRTSTLSLHNDGTINADDDPCFGYLKHNTR